MNVWPEAHQYIRQLISQVERQIRETDYLPDLFGQTVRQKVKRKSGLTNKLVCCVK